jgi:two-component system KDP operon response regulator KdpE
MGTASDKTRVLVIDDEPPIRRLLRTSLTAEGFEVLEAENAGKALALVGTDKPDVAILDLGLPDLDGLDIIRQVRGTGSKMPIIVLSSRAGERGKVEALDLGADDYVTKPFGIAELVARIRTALRHRFQQQGGEPLLRSGDLSVDLVRRLVRVKGEEVKLSPKEYDILRLLVLHAGKVLTHRVLMQEVWGAAGDVQYLRIYVRQLRQKIETDPESPAHILTETGVGYRLRVQDEPDELAQPRPPKAMPKPA